MNYKKIEELFVDFILDLTGPTPELEEERVVKFETTKNIIINKLNSNYPYHNTYILPYGSFPMKVYLKNADIDITIILQSKDEKKIIMEMEIEFINHILKLIKEEFEKYNKNANCTLFSELKIIMADVPLLKGKIGNISLDISVNNFSGIYKVVLIEYIENQLKNGFNRSNLFSDNSYNNNKIQIFRRTLILIKSWCLFEGNLMGSNIGLMASYALEILVICMFNLYYDKINSEFDGFQKFFEIMDNFEWKKYIISIFEINEYMEFQKKLDKYNTLNQKPYIVGAKNCNINNNSNNNINEPFWYLNNKKGKDNNSNNSITMKRISINSETDNDKEKDKNDKGKNIILEDIVPLMKLNEVVKLISPINKSMGNIYLQKEDRVINPKNFDKSINILDPLNNHNNLGKSISFHSKSKMEKIINYMNLKFENIRKMRLSGIPFFYMNSLLNLFKISLTTTYIDFFINYMNHPRIIANSKLFKKYIKTDDKKRNKISKEEYDKFNNLFYTEKDRSNMTHIEEEEYDKYIEESKNSSEDEEEKIEKTIEDEMEEDEYAGEEEEENYEIAEEKKEKNKSNEFFEKLGFIPLINNKVIKILYDLIDNKEKTIKFNDDLLKKSLEYSNNLNKLLKENKLI